MISTLRYGPKKKIGWGSTFRTTKCRMTDISRFRILKERKMSYSIFLISNLFLYLFKLFERSKYMIIYKIQNWYGIWVFQIRNFWNCLNWKINKFIKFIQLGKPKFASKNGLFWNCSSLRYFTLLAILPILIFALWYKSIFSISISYFSDSWALPFYIWTFAIF